MPACLFWLLCSLGGLFPAHFSVARGQLLTTTVSMGVGVRLMQLTAYCPNGLD